MVDKIENNSKEDEHKFDQWENAPTYHELKSDLDMAKTDHGKYVARLKQFRIDFNGGKDIIALPNKSTVKSHLWR